MEVRRNFRDDFDGNKNLPDREDCSDKFCDRSLQHLYSLLINTWFSNYDTVIRQVVSCSVAFAERFEQISSQIFPYFFVPERSRCHESGEWGGERGTKVRERLCLGISINPPSSHMAEGEQRRMRRTKNGFHSMPRMNGWTECVRKSEEHIEESWSSSVCSFPIINSPHCLLPLFSNWRRWVWNLDGTKA